jgi:hypothetical protein
MAASAVAPPVAGQRTTQPLPVAPAPAVSSTDGPGAGRGWLLLVGALVMAALAVVAYLVLDRRAI